jgi:hypothetical protein
MTEPNRRSVSDQRMRASSSTTRIVAVGMMLTRFNGETVLRDGAPAVPYMTRSLTADSARAAIVSGEFLAPTEHFAVDSLPLWASIHSGSRASDQALSSRRTVVHEGQALQRWHRSCSIRWANRLQRCRICSFITRFLCRRRPWRSVCPAPSSSSQASVAITIHANGCSGGFGKNSGKCLVCG